MLTSEPVDSLTLLVLPLALLLLPIVQQTVRYLILYGDKMLVGLLLVLHCAFMTFSEGASYRPLSRFQATRMGPDLRIAWTRLMFMSLWNSLMKSCRCPEDISLVRAARWLSIDQMRSHASPSVIPTPGRKLKE